jgi:hypothetical protein
MDADTLATLEQVRLLMQSAGVRRLSLDGSIPTAPTTFGQRLSQAYNLLDDLLEDDGGTVEPPPPPTVVSVAVTASSDTVVIGGGSETLTATVTWSDSTTSVPTSGVTWSTFYPGFTVTGGAGTAAMQADDTAAEGATSVIAQYSGVSSTAFHVNIVATE